VLAPFVPPPPDLPPGKTRGGPFSLGDTQRTMALLSDTGWTNAKANLYDETATVELDGFVNPTQLEFLGVARDDIPAATAALAAHAAQFENGHGLYALPIAYQIVTARRA
jgi:hypothetical protein